MSQKMTAAEFDRRIGATNARMGAEIEELQRKKAALLDLLERRRRHMDQLEATVERLQNKQEGTSGNY